MLIHQSVFRTLASGNLITSDLGWQEAGLTDNTNSFIMGGGDGTVLLWILSLSLSDPVIVAAGVTLGETLRGLAHMKLSSEIIHLSTAGYMDAGRKAALRLSWVTVLTIGSQCQFHL